MRPFLYHVMYEFKTGLRDKGLLLMIYLFPIAFYAMMGAIMTKINPYFGETMAPAMMIFAGMTATLLGLPSPMVAAREQGVYRSYWINGVPPLNLLVIPVLAIMVHLIIVSAIIALSSHPAFGGGVPTNWAAFSGITLLSILCMASFGLLLGVVSSNARMTMLLAQCIFLPSTMLGGLMMPLDTLPADFQRIAMLFPATQAMNAFRGYAMGLPAVFPPIYSVAALAAGAGCAFAAAALLFSWDAKNEKKKPMWIALMALLPFALVAMAGR